MSPGPWRGPRRHGPLRAAWLLIAVQLVACGGPAPSRETLLEDRGVYQAALSRDGRELVLGRRQAGIDLAALGSSGASHDLTYRRDRADRLVAAAFDPSDDYLVTATRQLVVVWSRGGAVIRAWAPPSEPRAVALAGDPLRVLLAMDVPTVAFFDARSGELLQQLYHDDTVTHVAMDDAAALALTASEDGSARLWSLADGREIRRWSHDDAVRRVALSGDGRLALTAARGGAVALWNTRDGSPVAVLFERNPGISTARFSADGSRLLTGTDDLEVHLWRTDDGTSVAQWTATRRNHWRPDGETVLDVAFLDTPNTVAAVAENGLAFEFDVAP